MAHDDSKDTRKARALESALVRQFGQGVRVEVEGTDVYVASPGAEFAERYAISHASWEILEAAIERDVPLEDDTEIVLLPPNEGVE